MEIEELKTKDGLREYFLQVRKNYPEVSEDLLSKLAVNHFFYLRHILGETFKKSIGPSSKISVNSKYPILGNDPNNFDRSQGIQFLASFFEELIPLYSEEFNIEYSILSELFNSKLLKIAKTLPEDERNTLRSKYLPIRERYQGICCHYHLLGSSYCSGCPVQ